MELLFIFSAFSAPFSVPPSVFAKPFQTFSIMFKEMNFEWAREEKGENMLKNENIIVFFMFRKYFSLMLASWSLLLLWWCLNKTDKQWKGSQISRKVRIFFISVKFIFIICYKTSPPFLAFLVVCIIRIVFAK